MNTEKYEIGKPMDDLTFRHYLKSGKIPVRLSTQNDGPEYDIKFFVRNKGNRFPTNQFRIYFGNYFRLPSLKIESMSIGSGKPYKTDSIIVLLNPPSSIEKRFAVKSNWEQKTPGRNPSITVGYLDSRSVISLLLETAKEVGIPIRMPNRPSESMSMFCRLIPLVKDGVEDPYKCILQIDKTEYI